MGPLRQAMQPTYDPPVRGRLRRAAEVPPNIVSRTQAAFSTPERRAQVWDNAKRLVTEIPQNLWNVITGPQRAYTGELQVGGPGTGQPFNPEAIGLAAETAGTVGLASLPLGPGGPVLGSGPLVSSLYKGYQSEPHSGKMYRAEPPSPAEGLAGKYYHTDPEGVSFYEDLYGSKANAVDIPDFKKPLLIDTDGSGIASAKELGIDAMTLDELAEAAGTTVDDILEEGIGEFLEDALPGLKEKGYDGVVIHGETGPDLPGVPIEVVDMRDKAGQGGPISGPMFHSGLSRAIGDLQPKGTIGQYVSTLRNTPGVKNEEIKDLGLDKLDPNTKVSQEQFKMEATRNSPELIIDNKLENSKGADFKEQAIQAISDTVEEDGVLSWLAHTRFEHSKDGNYTGDEFETAVNKLREDMENAPDPYGKYMEYVREIAEEDPGRIREELAEWDVYLGGSSYDSRDYRHANVGMDLDIDTKDYAEILVKLPETNEKNNFWSSHWDDPNVLLHIRGDTRKIEGVDAFFMDELQSDLHATGRESGYRGDTSTPLAQARTRLEAWYDKEGIPRDATIIADPFTEKLKAAGLYDDWKLVTYKKDGTRRGRPVLDAPFKKSWVGLGLKVALQEAIKRGHTRFAWAGGHIQKARWGADWSWLYDRDIPKELKSIVGKNIEVKSFGDVGEFRGRSAGGEDIIHYIDIPDEFIAKVKNDGLPLYSKGLPVSIGQESEERRR